MNLTDRISLLTKAIASDFKKLKADLKDNLDSINSLSNSVSDAHKAISKARTDLSNEIEQSIDDIEVGGRNLFKDSKVYNKNSALFEGSTSRAWSGDKRYLIIGYKEGGDNIVINLPADLVDGKTYTLSFKTLRKYPPFSFQVQLGALEKEFRTIESDKPSLHWITFEHSIKNNQVLIFCKSGAAAVIIKEYKLERGNKPSDWTPAPEDIQSAIDNISEDSTKLHNGEASLNVKSIAAGLDSPKISFKEVDFTYSTNNGEILVPHGLSSSDIVFSVQVSVYGIDKYYHPLSNCLWDKDNLLIPVSNNNKFIERPAKAFITYEATS